MPTLNSTVRGVRVLDKDYEQVMKMAERRGWTFNKAVNYCIRLGTRSHKKKGADNG